MQFSVRASLEQFALAHPAGAGELKISVAAPAGAEALSNAPVLYVVDGDLLFGLAAEIGRVLSAIASLPPYYVVGIGYDAAYADVLKLRTADLSPPISALAREKMGALGDMIGSEHNGGADAFVSFVAGALRTEINARYPQTLGGDEILFGHSLGGLFAAHALLTRPDAFSSFIVSSPSLWWDQFSILQKLPAFKPRLASISRQPRVFVDVGAKEQHLPESVPDGAGLTLEDAQAQIRAARMVDAAREFADALREAGLTELRHVAFAEDDHVSAAPAALLHGVRFALGRNG